MSIHEELLGKTKLVRARLASAFEWFTHDTPKINLVGIQMRGLLPQRPFFPCPQVVLDSVDNNAGEILCLYPNSAALRPSSSSADPLMRLALRSSDLPDRLGLDWSYPESWHLAEVLHDANPLGDCLDVVVEVARRRGSVVSYDGIAAAKLRVWTDEIGSDPSTWPSLLDATATRVRTLGVKG